MGALSPSFVHVLEPGDGYVGGEVFFGSGSKYVETIPASDVFAANSLPNDPPESLIKAMRVFFVGLAYSILVRNEGEAVRRSMLIHPSRLQSDHQQMHSWATRIVGEWGRTLGLNDNDPDRIDMLSDFKKAYDDLHRTEKSLPPFEDIVGKLPRSLRRTQVIEFNTNGRPKTPEIDWQDANGWILIGGQAVDRGFTVDSLTVTYMGRNIGTGNADSVQQRARFFGYKKKYLGICRVYLEPGTRSAFSDYVKHEEIMRAELQSVATSGESLRDWKRRFALSPALRLCRSSVIALGDDLIRGKRNGGWTQQRDAFLTDDLREGNAKLLSTLEGKCTFAQDTSFSSTSSSQTHFVARGVPLLEVIDILVDYRMLDGRDNASLTGLLLQLGHISRNSPQTTAAVYKMRPGVVSRRTVDAAGMLPDGFQQGRTGDGVGRYPGDAFFSSKDEVSLQIHHFALDDKAGAQIATDAPMIAIHIPSKIAIDWLVQNQAGQ
nr:Z1 domain-containing protein [Agrobacterium tumefaciens]